MKIKKRILVLVLLLTVLLCLTFFLRKVLFRPKQMAKAKVAIVIDDWGYNLRYLHLLREINVPLTVSVLPNLRYSAKAAEAAKAQGKEVILHLPLEPEIAERGYIGLEKDTITSAMPKDEVIAKFELALASVPNVKGVSNHMGSLATKDTELMSVILGQIKKRRLFFLDNLVTDESVCKQLAQNMGLKFAARDFFLDNLDNDEYIRGQFKKFREFAHASGKAIAIGHVKLKTLKILKDEIARMQDEGIEFVFVSDLVR